MEDLATEAEGMIGRPITLQQACRLSMNWAGLCWPAMSPEVIALSCRASLLPGVGPPGVIVAEGLPDQIDEIRARLDGIFEAAKADPSALVVEAHPPMILRPPTEADKRRVGRPRKRPGALPLEEAEPLQPPDPDELPDVWRLPEPLEQAEPVELPEPLEEPDPDELPAAWQQPEPDPQPLEVPEVAPPPPGWFDQFELAQLLEVGTSTISRWRVQGRAGSEGADWCRLGKRFHYAPELAERLLQQAQDAAASRARPTIEPADPLRWVGTERLAQLFGLSEAWVARARRLGWLQEGTHYRKPKHGEFPGNPHIAKGWVYDLAPSLIALAAASGRPVPEVPAGE